MKPLGLLCLALAVSAPSQVGCRQRSATLKRPSVESASPTEMAFRPPSQADLPGKGWHCFHWTSHIGLTNDRRWLAGQDCYRSVADCRTRQNSGFHRNTKDRQKECMDVVQQAFCVRVTHAPATVSGTSSPSTLHCFATMHACAQFHALASEALLSDCIALD